MIGEMVEVAWVDHTLHIGEYTPSKSGLTLRLSVGYLIRQDEEVVVIAQTSDIGGTYEDCLWFIAGCVVDVTELKRRKKS